MVQSVSNQSRNCLESMEKYCEAKIYKSKPETRNGNVNAVYFYSSVEIFESVASGKAFVYDKQARECKY